MSFRLEYQGSYVPLKFKGVLVKLKLMLYLLEQQLV